MTNLFAQIGLSDNILQAISTLDYTTPTPIQQKMIPQILMGHDVMGLAATGSGKTAAFTLPILDILANEQSRFRMPRALILAPTRELAIQIEDNINLYGKFHQQSYASLIGGVSMDAQSKLLDKNIDIVIATPGRFLDHCQKGNILCNDIRIFILDEADRMFDMGFQQELDAILKLLPAKRQNVFLSATMPKNVNKLAQSYLNNPKKIQINQENKANTDIEQYMLQCAENDKIELLKNILHTDIVQSALIFCNKKSDVDKYGRALQKHGFNVGILHGDMAQNIRLEWLNKFKEDKIDYLVCSDVAARGLDIKSVSHVINVNVPQNPEDYIHRIGRTGRAGMKGCAITFVSKKENNLWHDVSKFQNKTLEPAIFHNGQLSLKKNNPTVKKKNNKNIANKTHSENIDIPFKMRDDVPAFLK